jgi:hypothetical protein
VPLNVCGNTIDVIGVLDPAFGNVCADLGHSDNGDDGNNGDNGSYGS